MKKEVKFVINKSEITAGTRGASLGPEAIITAARKSGSDFFAHYEQVFLEDVNHYLDHEIKYPLAKRIGGLLQVFENVSNGIQEVVREGKFPFLLSGDHGSAGGTIAGIKAAFPDKRLGVIWIDAHADIHTPYTTPSGNMHGMPLATALGVDNLEEKANEPIPEVVAFWEQLKNVGIPGAKIQPENLLYIAVRDTEDQEDAVLKRLNIVNHPVSSVRLSGAEEIANRCLTALKDCEILYISFDVDSMDPELSSRGTGTPVGNGLTPEEAGTLLKTFAKDPRTQCIEFVEVNPCLDDKVNRMAEIAFDLLQQTVNQINNT